MMGRSGGMISGATGRGGASGVGRVLGPSFETDLSGAVSKAVSMVRFMPVPCSQDVLTALLGRNVTVGFVTPMDSGGLGLVLDRGPWPDKPDNIRAICRSFSLKDRLPVRF